MQFQRPLDAVLRGTTSIRILRILLRHPARQFTGREIARMAKVAPSKAILHLARLQDQGMVERTVAGASHLWKVLPEHYLCAALKPALDAEADARRALCRILVRHLDIPEVERAVLFGSTARGDSRPASDVDVLLVVGSEADRAGAERHASEASEELFRIFGNPLNEITYTRAELRRKKGLPLLRNIEREGLPLLERDTVESEEGRPRARRPARSKGPRVPANGGGRRGRR